MEKLLDEKCGVVTCGEENLGKDGGVGKEIIVWL